jgi:hypothetical protein
LSLDLDLAREKFESSQDFTIGLEEEFAILDPRTLELEHRFEEVFAACREDGVLAESAAGEPRSRSAPGARRLSPKRFRVSGSGGRGSSTWSGGWG